MSKSQTAPRHRYTRLVHALYALAVVAMVVHLATPGRVSAAAGLLMYTLPLVAFGVDIWHTPIKEESK